MTIYRNPSFLLRLNDHSDNTTYSTLESASPSPSTMSPVAANTGNDAQTTISKPVNFFYSPDAGKGDADDNDKGYEFAKYKARGKLFTDP